MTTLWISRRRREKFLRIAKVASYLRKSCFCHIFIFNYFFKTVFHLQNFTSKKDSKHLRFTTFPNRNKKSEHGSQVCSVPTRNVDPSRPWRVRRAS